jgi:hypothetical protein
MNNFAVKELYSEKHVQLPSVSSLLKISLGLILFTMISTALVYAETMSVDVDGTPFDIEYDVTGMSVSGIEADTDFISLILTVDVTESSGTLDIVLDRSFFDSKFQGLDDEYIILADGDEPNFSELEATPQSRTLSIELPAGTEEIEIIGSVFGDTSSGVPDNTDEDADKAAADKAAADKAAADKAAADKAAADNDTPKAAADKAAADKAAADNDTPKTQCGPGTILQNGACVLDERCGPGTILQDGACVLDSTSQTSSSSKGMGKDSIMGFAAAFVIAGIVAVVFGIIAKASKSN